MKRVVPMFNDQQQNNNNFYNDFFAFGLIDIISLIIGLQNMQLNITGKDLDSQTKTILEDIHSHLSKQDKHLEMQDKHLFEQDRRIAILEKQLEKTIGITDKE